MTMVLCRSCHAPIFFAVSSKGHRIPIDMVPVVDGNVIIDGEAMTTGGEVLPRALVLGKADAPLDDPQRFVAHFVTCPDAKKHRRR